MQPFASNFLHPLYLLLLQKSFNMRIKEIHLVNVPPFADVMVNLVKMVLKPKLISRVSGTGLNWGEYYVLGLEAVQCTRSLSMFQRKVCGR